MAMTRQTIVGVFDEPGMADNAIDALQQAGFNADQVYYSAHATNNGGNGGFLEGLRRLFTDNETGAAGHVSHDLTNFGLSGDEADYYDREYQAGHGVVAVRAGGRTEEALNILQTNGAHSYTSGSAAAGGTSYDADTTTTATSGAATDATTTAASGTATYDNTNATPNVNATATSTGYATNANTTAAPTNYNADANTHGYNVDATGTGATTDYATDAAPSGATTDYTTDATANYATNTTDATNATNTADYDTINAGTSVDNAGTDVDTDEQRRLRLREERLNVDKQAVQTGQVGLHKEVVSEQKNIDVPVTHEEVFVERRPVTDGQADDATPIGEGEKINMPVSAEQVNVSKDTVTTGEVGIGKRAVEGTQRVSDTVRREEARVDQSGDVPVQNTTSTGYTTDGTTDTAATDGTDTTTNNPNR